MVQIHLGMPEMKVLGENQYPPTENHHLDPRMPLTGPLIDRFGRIVRDVRISLTDKCNLRCTYCMPKTNIDYIASQALLQESHFHKIIRCAFAVGITTFRFTGGEPLLSPLLIPLISYTSSYAAERGISIDIALTTNGILLADKIDTLMRHGLHRVTISIDTIDPTKFTELTLKNRLPAVLAGIEASLSRNIPLKLNAVLYDNTALDNVPQLLAFASKNQIPIRFIEQMPLSPGVHIDATHLPTAAHLRERLTQLGTLNISPVPRENAPAQMYTLTPHPLFTLENGISSQPINIGIIAAMSEPFCAHCDRTRISSDGKVRNCLFSAQEYALNTSETDWNTLPESHIILQWRAAMWKKAASYQNAAGQMSKPARGMHAIGG